MRQRAQGELQQKSGEEIEAKIKELGLTRAEAESRARELGIDLSTYLTQKSVGRDTSAIPSMLFPVDTLFAKEPTVKPDTTRIEPLPKKLGPGGLPYFGYDIFAHTPAAFEPSAVGPVDPEYLIGPEDILRVAVWGQVEFQNELRVDNNGKIFIPTIGQFLVSGQTLEQAYKNLLKQMSRSYSGLVSQPPSVWMDLTLSRLRPKRIYVMGEVQRPGGYTVSSYATVFSALFSVGGPTTSGSLREVRVVRGNKVIARVDLYDYLTGADKTNDIRVQNNDIIFVPPRGKTVSMNREVLRPAIYELLAHENLTKLLEISGGALPTAYLERVQVDRVIPFDERKEGDLERKVIDVDFRTILNAKKDYALFDGDIISLYSVKDIRRNIVTIEGAVKRPGTYQLEKAPTLRALFQASEGLEPKAYLELGHLIRYNEDDITKKVIPFVPSKILSDVAEDIQLAPRDEIRIHSTETTEIKEQSVVIRGSVKLPGKFPLYSGMTLNDLVMFAGGYTEDAELLLAEVSRLRQGGFGKDTLAVIVHPRLQAIASVPGASQPSEKENFILLHRDEVLIRPNPNYRPHQNISVEGDIRYPGVYAMKHKGERLSEILNRAGGPTVTSYLGGALFIREGKRLLLDFDKGFYQKDPIHDVLMFPGDRIVVPSVPNTVLMMGEVNKPGLLSFIAGENVSDYINRSGGKTDSASYAVLTKPTGESMRVNFGFLRSNPNVPDGSIIDIKKIPPPAPEERGESTAVVVKDIFSILTAAATLAFIVWQTTR